jgi:hypothetical protein
MSAESSSAAYRRALLAQQLAAAAKPTPATPALGQLLRLPTAPADGDTTTPPTHDTTGGDAA